MKAGRFEIQPTFVEEDISDLTEPLDISARFGHNDHHQRALVKEEKHIK